MRVFLKRSIVLRSGCHNAVVNILYFGQHIDISKETRSFTIKETFDCVYICLWILYLPPPLVNHANWEIYSLICFLSVKRMKVTEIMANIQSSRHARWDCCLSFVRSISLIINRLLQWICLLFLCNSVSYEP